MSNNQVSYFSLRPIHSESIAWSVDENGMVTLDIENKGVFNRIFQKLFKKPKVSHIHLDELGSFVWRLIDGERDVYQMCELLEEGLGEKAHPTYERLKKFLDTLEEYKFIKWNF